MMQVGHSIGIVHCLYQLRMDHSLAIKHLFQKNASLGFSLQRSLLFKDYIIINLRNHIEIISEDDELLYQRLRQTVYRLKATSTGIGKEWEIIAFGDQGIKGCCFEQSH
jgi:hypothetical protein